jgi:hypothetical protein
MLQVERWCCSTIYESFSEDIKLAELGIGWGKPSFTRLNLTRPLQRRNAWPNRPLHTATLYMF